MIDFIQFVNQEVDEWRCQDGGLTNAACDVIQAAFFLQKVGGPVYEDYFSQDYGTQEAAELWDVWVDKLGL